MTCTLHGVLNIFNLPEIFVPKKSSLIQSDDELKINLNVFHWGGTSFVRASISSSVNIGET